MERRLVLRLAGLSAPPNEEHIGACPPLQMAKSGGLGRLEGARVWDRATGGCQQPGRAHRGCVGCETRGQ